MREPRSVRVGIDVGGTFTDLVAVDVASGRLVDAFKLPSTPSDPGAAMLAGFQRLIRTASRDGTEPLSISVCHGTTVGTNALIERRGGATALVATRGFADVIELRRQARPNLYALRQRISEPLVPRALRFEAAERMAHDGTVLEPLTDEAIAAVVERIASAGVDAVAICLLHAYANDTHERRLGEAIAARLPRVFVTLSSEINPEYREFERTSTSVVNSYIGPAVASYIARIDGLLRDAGTEAFSIVKSNGGRTSAELARRFPAHLIESGPAAGVIAAAHLGELIGAPNVIAFDMGGTTAKVGVILDGKPRMTTEFYADRLVDGVDVGGFPVMSPVVDVIEIGAGGGSIAWLDTGGVIKVGPRSAGAQPGPACYGRGGELPTITDAHVVLGTLTPAAFADTEIALDTAAAHRALGRHLADPLGWPVERAARAVIEIATAKMAEMVRLATLRRGLDPRDFIIVPYGGAGPLHAAHIAAEVGIPRVVVPPWPGMFSATGALLAEVRHDLVKTEIGELASKPRPRLQEGFAGLSARARDLLASEGVGARSAGLQRLMDLRYRGQLFALQIDAGAADAELPDASEIERRFRSSYRETYGYDLEQTPVELVNLRLIATHRAAPVSLAELPPSAGGAPSRSAAEERLFLHRDDLRADCSVRGPAVVLDRGATVQVLPTQAVRAGAAGTLLIETEHPADLS